MRHSLLLLFAATLLFTLSSCEKELDVVNEEPIEAEKLLYEGIMEASSRYDTEGKISVAQVDDRKILQFTDFMTDSGPDLRIYLSKDRTDNDFVEISTNVKNGTYTVELPDDIDIASKPYVLIWCKRFSVLFGSGLLKKV